MDTENDSSEVIGGGSLRRSLRERPRKPNVDRRLRGRSDELKFLEDFDPEKSNREKRKMKRKCNTSRTSSYDEQGRIRHNGLDVCDCMNDACPGCWYECECCGSTKCGVQCRVNRKVYYECIAFDGKDASIRNNHFPNK